MGILIIYTLFLFFSIVVTVIGLYNLITYILGKKVKAIISDVKEYDRFNGTTYAVSYTYNFKVNNEYITINGPKNYVLLPPLISKERKFGKRVYISYNEKKNKVSLQLHTILWWSIFGILGTCAFIIELKKYLA